MRFETRLGRRSGDADKRKNLAVPRWGSEVGPESDREPTPSDLLYRVSRRGALGRSLLSTQHGCQATG